MKTKQDYRTPPAFIEAVALRFGRPTFDLCATPGEQIEGVEHYFSPEQDSLAQSWGYLQTPNEDDRTPRVVWLNPPFANIEPWAKKLTSECCLLKRWTLMLVPASIGTEWFAKHVQGKALVLGLSPRITFQGCDAPYPKDLMLVCVGFGVVGFDTWKWNRTVSCPCGDDCQDPGPAHTAECPWSDPEYDAGGF